MSAVRQNGDLRDGAAVADITAAVDVSAWPRGARLIVRREPLHPGAQQTLDDIDGARFTVTGRRPTLRIERTWLWVDVLVAAFTRLRPCRCRRSEPGSAFVDP